MIRKGPINKLQDSRSLMRYGGVITVLWLTRLCRCALALFESLARPDPLSEKPGMGGLRAQGQAAKLLLVCCFLPPAGFLLNFFYQNAGPARSPLWQKALTVNAVLALCVLLIRVSRGRLQAGADPVFRPSLAAGRKVLPFLPACVVGAGILLSLSRLPLHFFTGFRLDFIFLSFVCLIPLAEELVFRIGLSGFLGKFLCSRFWGSYFSVLFFSWLHSFPESGSLFGAATGLVVGPLLLGFVNELLWHCSGSLLPPLLLHMACNASGYLFLYGDGGWFRPFEWLYQ